MDIEHPDHTGSSSNPSAPWNQPDAPDPDGFECTHCDADLCAGGREEGDECPYKNDPDAPCEGKLTPVFHEPEPPCRCPGDSCYC